MSHENTKSTKGRAEADESHVLREAQFPDTKSTNVEFDPLSNKVIGSALKVHRELGPGFIESIYHAALLVQLKKDGMRVDTEKAVVIRYAGVEVGAHRMDMVVEESLVVELKAADGFDGSHLAQVLSYLKATGLKVGLLLNFGRAKLGVRRVVL